MSKFLILNANPKTRSFGHQLADAYQQAVSDYHPSGADDIRRFDLSTMVFEPSLNEGYEQPQPLESSLNAFLAALQWADHLLVVSPVWWGGVPAKFKGLIDRVFLPGLTFKFEADNPLPVPLLSGKTARLVLTMDAPQEYADIQAQPVLEQLQRFTLEFCGMTMQSPVLIPAVSFSSDEQKRFWLKTLSELGQAGR